MPPIGGNIINAPPVILFLSQMAGDSVDVPISKDNEAPNAERTARASQRKRRLGNLLNSPILLVMLLLATVGLAFKWHAIQKSLDAPILPGWNWSSHPNSLLIYYPNTDCGCGPGLLPALKQALSGKLNVVVVSNVQGQKLTAVTQQMKNSHVPFVVCANPQSISPLFHSNNMLQTGKRYTFPKAN